MTHILCSYSLLNMGSRNKSKELYEQLSIHGQITLSTDVFSIQIPIQVIKCFLHSVFGMIHFQCFYRIFNICKRRSEIPRLWQNDYFQHHIKLTSFFEIWRLEMLLRLRILHPITLSLKYDSRAVMQQPIRKCRCYYLILEYLSPLRIRLIWSKDNWPLLISGTD